MTLNPGSSKAKAPQARDLKSYSVVLLTDTKSGVPHEVIKAIKDCGFSVAIRNSKQTNTKESADILIVDRCSSIVPQSYWNQFPLHFNLHPSLLPLHRGAHPIFWAALFNDPIGVTAHELTKL